ncbi:MAG TPA: hypothetical protein VK324_05680 [Tepidisphaeraceae bacterium]|nr:hypothetical protein [Tepidisphaeraceae bacterium]
MPLPGGGRRRPPGVRGPAVRHATHDLPTKRGRLTPAVTQPVRASRARRPDAVRAAVAATCEALEDRRLFSAYGWYSVKVPTPGGTHGNAALHTVGSLTADANDWHPTNDPVDAVNRRVTGTATVDSTPENAWLATHGQTGRVDTYTFGSSDAFRVNGDGTKIEFEDLKSFPTPPNDDDYDDHSWAVTAARQSLGSLSAKVSATASPANAVTDSGDLYVGEVDGRVSLDIAATLGGSGVTAGHRKHTVWDVKGPDTANEIALGDFAGSTTATAEFPVPTHGRTVTVRVAFDDDASNTVSDNDTHVKEITVHIVKVEQLQVDAVSPAVPPEEGSVTVTAPPPAGEKNLVVMERANGTAQVALGVTVAPTAPEAKARVFWKVDGTGTVGPASSGSFGGSAPTITLTPPSARSATDGIYTVSAGFDDNGNGELDAAEVDLQAKVYVLEVVKTEWVSSAASPVSDNPNAGEGKRIYPDKTSPTDTFERDRVTVRAQVWPVPPKPVKVYFQSYDVDDPSADAEIDPNGTAGLDNIGTTPGQRGNFPSEGTNYRAPAFTDDAGRAIQIFQTTMQPGDNFRVAAALAGPELDKITDNTVPPSGAQMPAGTYAGRLSDMLTVWRRLWIERDHMEAPPALSVNVTVLSVRSGAGVGGRDVIRLARHGDPDNAPLGTSEDEYEGGMLAIPSLSKNIPVFLSRTEASNQFVNVTVSHDALTSDEVTFGLVATLKDDDTQAQPALPDSGGLLQSAFSSAYIRPEYADTFNDHPTVPFYAKLGDSLASIEGSRDLSSSPGFWTTLVVGCYENTDDTDADADGTPTGLAPQPELSGIPWDLGYAGSGQFLDTNTIAIYMETLADVTSQRITDSSEQHVVVHEIGHSAGSGLNGHNYGGIMQAGAPSDENEFDSESLRFFRVVTTW